MYTLQAAGDILKVALWLDHASIQTARMYLRADPTEKRALLEVSFSVNQTGAVPGALGQVMQILAVATQRS